MKEIKNIVEAYRRLDFNKNQAALATVIHVEGSSYRRVGARMLVLDSGEWIGGISGGCLEGDALRKARWAMLKNEACLVRYDTREDDPAQIGIGLGCNGLIDVLISPLDPNDPHNAVECLAQLLEERKTNVLLTVVGLPNAMEGLHLGDVFFEDECQISPLPLPDLFQDIQHAKKSERSLIKQYHVDNKLVEVLIEIFLPPIHLVLCGSNYDIYPMTRIAKELGWKLTVSCNPLKMRQELQKIAEVVEKNTKIELDFRSAVVLMSHDYAHDYAALPLYLASSVPYIGMLGPAKRNEKMYVQFREDGKTISTEDLSRIFNPVGLDIGASTPEEIAVSVIAEIIAFFRNRTGGNLKYRPKPIYQD